MFFSVSHANPCNIDIDMLHDLHAHIAANQHLLSLGITLPTCKTCFWCDADGLYHASSGWNVFSTGLGNRCTSAAWRTALWFVVVIVLVVYMWWWDSDMSWWCMAPLIILHNTSRLQTCNRRDSIVEPSDMEKPHKDFPGIESFGSWAPYKVGYPTSCLVGVKCCRK